MLDLRYIEANSAEVRSALERRGGRFLAELDKLLSFVDQRRAGITRLEALRTELNSESAAMAKVDKQSEAFARKRDVLRELSSNIAALEKEVKIVEDKVREQALSLPNVPHAACPKGTTPDDNPVVRVVGEKPMLSFDARDHVEIGEQLHLFDTQRAAKLSGARFALLTGAGAKLERVLAQFMLNVHTEEHGYNEITPPVIVRKEALVGTGQLPKFEADLFKLELKEKADGADHERYLIPTAEVPLTNMHGEEILAGASLPLQYVAYTQCFRSEAGSYGKDTRGLIRHHQFSKVELVQLVTPESAEASLEALTLHAESILKKLELHYRVVELCHGDLGFASKKTYDLEVWLPGQNAYREISSCSWFGDFQARRANIRYRPTSEAKPAFVHTLNGSGLALSRTLVAILEQYQQADGSVRVPQVLVPLMGTERLSA